DLVVAIAGLDDIVTRATLDGVAEIRGQGLSRHGGAGGNVDDIVLRRADDRDADVPELGDAHGLVGELQVFDTTQGIRPVGRARLQIEDLELTATGIGNQIVCQGARVASRVDAKPADNRVVAAAANQLIVARAAIETVVRHPAGDEIGT